MATMQPAGKSGIRQPLTAHLAIHPSAMEGVQLVSDTEREGRQMHWVELCSSSSALSFDSGAGWRAEEGAGAHKLRGQKLSLIHI